jgi:pimeloyl-ACP methyl ester carboxylesterase
MRDGTPGAPPLVLVHGFGASNHSWRKWRPLLERDHELHLVELAGFGGAPIPRDGDFSPEAQARALALYLEELRNPEAPVLVGHSLGGAVVLLATLAAMDRPDPEEAPRPRLPRGLVVVSGAVFPQRFPPYISMARIAGLGELLLAVQPPSWAIRAGIRGIVHDPATVDDVQVEGYRRPLVDPDRRRAIVQASRQILPASGEDLTARYREIQLPLLALWGARDRVVDPANAHRLARTVPRGRAVILPEVGHLPPEEAPERTVEEVRRFMETLE